MATDPAASGLPRRLSERLRALNSGIAVVGAGVSGLFAARTLRDHGLDVTVFDKARVPFDGAFVDGSALSWVARDDSKPGRSGAAGETRWVLHGSPEWSARHLEAAADEVADRLLEAFFEVSGLERREPRFLRAHRWRYSIAENPLDVGCLWHAGLRIGACGDWCSGSRVEGAFLSGMAIAGRLLGSAT